MGWLENIQAAPDSGAPAVVVDGGRVYVQNWQVQGRTDASDGSRSLIGYTGSAVGAKPGDKATLYDVSGHETGQFTIEDTDRDPIGKVILAAILAIGAGAAAWGAGLIGGGASAAGAGAVELGTASGADLSAFYGGLDGGATLGGGATLEGATVATTAATTAGSTATTAATTAATAARGGSLLTTIAGAASSALGVAASALGVRNAAAGTHPPAVSSNGAPVAVSGQGGGPDWPTFLFLGGAAAAVVWVFVQSKG